MDDSVNPQEVTFVSDSALWLGQVFLNRQRFTNRVIVPTGHVVQAAQRGIRRFDSPVAVAKHPGIRPGAHNLPDE